MFDNLPPSSSRDEHPSTIGPYHVLEVIGKGGMGVVYSAEQLHPVRRQVAIKMMRQGIDSRDVVSRFEAERHALAVMDHPGIARILDAGVSEDGRPYFVMELVKGVPIDRYCDRFRLTERERLALFIALCEAVQHAHQKGVIHRDLKPANVLVTERDGKPIPKVIDFGIAKATAGSFSTDPLVTSWGQAMGTLAYMSPEQAEGSELDVDTRADVYSLGIILFKLLAGGVPLDPAESGIPQFLVQLLARDTSPPTPRDRLAGDRETIERLALERGTDPSALRRSLDGDIKWVVMRAIEKDRNRRYETVNGLRLDLIRYLRREPVVARAPSTRYRLRKFVQRNRAGVAAGSAVLALLLVGMVMTTLGLRRARIAEGEALAAREEAQLEAESAQQVVDFLVSLFEVSDPGSTVGGSITARELLDRGARMVEDELGDQPLVQARMLGTIGAVYRKLGLLDDATILLGRALTLSRSALGEDAPDVAELHFELGATQRQRGDMDQAEENLRRALAIHTASDSVESDEVGHTLAALGSIQLVRGQLDEAEASLTRALSLEEARVGEEHLEIATIVSDLGALALYRGDFLGAESYFRRARAIRERRLGRDHRDVGFVLINLGAAFWYQDRMDEALEAYERAQEILDARLEPGHPQLAGVRNNVAEVYWKLGRLEEAEALFIDVLQRKERTLTPSSTSIATTLLGLANVYTDQARYDAAEPRYVRALRIMEDALGPDNTRLREPLQAYESMLRLAGRESDADAIARRIVALANSG